MLAFQTWMKVSNESKFLVRNYEHNTTKEYDELPKHINSYYVLKYSKTKKDYDKSIEENKKDSSIKVMSNRRLLKNYEKEIIACRNQLLECNTLNKINKRFDIFDAGENKTRTLDSLVKSFFGYISSHYKYNEKLERITEEEAWWFERTYNAGLTYTVKGVYDCFGYDYKNYYASILGSGNSGFKISEREGELKTLTKLPRHLQYGIYKCVIKSSNLHFNNFFHFNKHNIYTHYDIQLVKECQYTMEGIEYNLILNEPNAYVYDSKKLLESKKIFGYWFNTITQLKNELKGNCLVKFLSSSLWGFLSKKNIEIINEEQLFSGEISNYKIVDSFTKLNGNEYYKIFRLDNKYLYGTNFRLKPFITSYARCKMFRTIMNNSLFDNVLRVHTDGIILNKKFDFNKYDKDLIPEDKTTGKIEFFNINRYERKVI